MAKLTKPLRLTEPAEVARALRELRVAVDEIPGGVGTIGASYAEVVACALEGAREWDDEVWLVVCGQLRVVALWLREDAIGDRAIDVNAGLAIHRRACKQRDAEAREAARREASS